MTLLTVDVPQSLLSWLKDTGRSAQDVIIEALEQARKTAPNTSGKQQPNREVAQVMTKVQA